MNFWMICIVSSSCMFMGLVSSKCCNPPTAQGFNIEIYEGLWYEVAKYQTAGGAYFEKNCTCTSIEVIKNSKNIYAIQSCIKNGKNIAVNATLLETETPGKFIEKISVNKVGYWVIQLDESTAIEYDCSEALGVLNYCIHIMSRERTLQINRIRQLAQYALSLHLNANNLEMTLTNQNNCTNQQKVK